MSKILKIFKKVNIPNGRTYFARYKRRTKRGVSRKLIDRISNILNLNSVSASLKYVNPFSANRLNE